MQLEIKALHVQVDKLLKFCVAGTTTFVPDWSEAAIELGCQNNTFLLIFKVIEGMKT